MAGLLDDFSSFIKTPEGQGLLSGVFGYAANAKRGQPINSLGRGGIAGLMGYAGAQDREMQQAEAAKVNEYRTAQLDKMRADMEAQKQARAEAERVKGVVQQAMLGTSPLQAIGADAKGPTLEKAQMIGQRPALDANSLIGQGVPLETVKSLFEAQNFGKPKVARTVEGQDKDGNKVTYQLDEFGQIVGDGVQGYTAPVQVDLGGRVQFVRPQPGITLGKTMTPEGRDASARGWAGVRQAQARLDLDRGQNAFTFNADLGGYVPKQPGGKFVPLDGVQKAPGGRLTDAEAKSSLYLSQMLEATQALQGTNASPAGVAAAGSMFTNWAASDGAQRAAQAQRQWSEAYLRAKTGAAATESEVENNIKTYFPTVGDSAATIKRKEQARAAAEADMRIPAGRGAAQIKQSATQGRAEPLPANPSATTLRRGATYQTPRGAATWDGMKFTVVE